jgi:hypothetical protein
LIAKVEMRTPRYRRKPQSLEPGVRVGPAAV